MGACKNTRVALGMAFIDIFAADMTVLVLFWKKPTCGFRWRRLRTENIQV